MMRKIKKTIVFVMMLLLSLYCMACSSKPKVEITLADMTESKVLNVQYTANDDISKDDLQMKVSVSSDSGKAVGTVYCFSKINNDLEEDRRYVGLFYMNEERSWNVEGSLTLGGSTVTGNVNTSDILSLLGEESKITVSFVMGKETVSEKVVGSK